MKKVPGQTKVLDIVGFAKVYIHLHIQRGKVILSYFASENEIYEISSSHVADGRRLIISNNSTEENIP